MDTERQFKFRVVGALVLTVATACSSSPAVTVDSSTIIDAAQAIDAGHGSDGGGHLFDAANGADATQPIDAAPLLIDATPVPLLGSFPTTLPTFSAIGNGGFSSTTERVTITNLGGANATQLTPFFFGANSNEFSIVGGTCVTTTSLVPNGSCDYTIQFGPTTSNEAIGPRTATLQIEYNIDAAGDNTAIMLPVQGNVAQARPAVITPSIVASTGFSAGDGSTTSPLAIEDDVSFGTITVAYTNSGASAATGFFVSDQLSGSWTLIASNCSAINLVADGGFCTVVYQLGNWPGDGEFDLDLADLTSASWNDDTGFYSNQAIGGLDIVSALVFAPAAITLTTSGFIDASNDIFANGQFIVTATLTGGFEVPDQQIDSVQIEPISDFSQFVPNCIVNSTTPRCDLTYLINDSSVGAYTLTVGTEGDIPLSATAINFNVVPPSKYIFVSLATFNGNLGGFSGADAKCNNDVGTVRSDTPWKALLDSNNATTAGVNYFDTSNNFIATATDGDLASTLANALGGNGDVFTGGNGNSCNNWTSSVHAGNPIAGAGNAGATDSTWFFNHTIFCDAQARLICVQQ